MVNLYPSNASVSRVVREWLSRMWKWSVGSAALVVMVGVGPAAAQEVGPTSDWEVTPRFGVALPFGALGELLNPGLSAGARISRPIGSGFNVIGDLGVDFLRGRNIIPGSSRPVAPDLRLLHYLVGVERDLYVPPEPDYMRMTAEVAFGARTFRSDPFRIDGAEEDTSFHNTYFTLGGGVRFEFPLTERLDFLADGTAYVSLVDEDDTRDLSEYSLGWVEPFDRAVTVPIGIAFRIRV